MSDVRQRPRAGDVVWHHPTQEKLVVAAYDASTDRFAATGPVEIWFVATECVVLEKATDAEHRRTIVDWSTTSGERGAIARETMGQLWLGGTWTR